MMTLFEHYDTFKAKLLHEVGAMVVLYLVSSRMNIEYDCQLLCEI